MQAEESVRMLCDLIRDRCNYKDWFECYAGSVIMRLSYGKSINSRGDPYLR